jgi:asparagine synthase (glutamine-hydrolysing)
VPVGACLSGGIDSSAIVSVISKEFNLPNLNTYSAIYNKGERGDESDFIELYNGIVNNMHFVTPTYKSLLEDVDDYVACMQEPIPGTSAYAEYKVYELAKKSTTVILNGQGADEALAGYIYFFGFYFKELFTQFKWGKLIRESIN